VAAKFAALYIRVSTEDQTEFSPEAQKRALLNYANDHGFVVRESNIFLDESSGRKAEKRPAFMEMIARAKSKERPFEAILVHKFDRFARSREDSVVYKSLLTRECDVKVISITESIEDDKFAIILEAILEAMAEYYSLNLAEEVKKGMTEKALRGGLQSTPSFGYAVDKKENMLVPVESEARLVREIFSRFLSGEGYLSIARWLNSIGIKTHRGNQFENRTVVYMIRNPVYIGKLRWNPRGRTGRDYDNAHIILADAKHKPLIDKDTWEAAQKRAKALKENWKHHGKPASESKDWLTGLVHCSDCNLSLSRVKKHQSWRCSGYARGTCKSSQYVKDSRLKEALLRRLSEDFTTEKKLSYKKVGLKKSGFDEKELLRLQVSKIEKKLLRLREAYLDGVETMDAYKSAKGALEAEVLDLQEQMIVLDRETPQTQEAGERKPSIQSVVEILSSAEGSNVQKHEAITSVIASCIFDKQKNLLEIQYRYLAPTSCG